MAVFDTHSIKPGTTACIIVKPDTELEFISSIIFRFADQRTNTEFLALTYPDDTDITEDGDIIIALTQQDTMKFTDDIMVEAQYNYDNQHVSKTEIAYIDVKKTLGTSIIAGNKPDASQRKALVLEIKTGLIKEYVGIAFVPHVDEAGNLSWTNEHGLDNPGTVNIKGAPGSPGEKGDPGEKGAPGSDATVTAANIESALGFKPASADDVSELSKEKADKEFVVSIFEQLKALIEAGKTDEAIAVLDKAILDLAVLA